MYAFSYGKLVRACPLVLVLLAGCGGGGSASPVAVQTPAPTPTPTVGPLTTAPTALSLTGTAQSIAVTDPGYTGNFVASGCSGVATTTVTTATATVTVTPVGAGTCMLTISDSVGHSANVQVGSTTLGVPLQ